MRNCSCYKLTSFKFNSLANLVWVENTSYFNMAALQISYQVWTSYLDADYFARPLNLLEIEIKNSIQVTVETLIVTGCNECLKEVVKDCTSVGLAAFLLKTLSEQMLPLGDERCFSDCQPGLRLLSFVCHLEVFELVHGSHRSLPS